MQLGSGNGTGFPTEIDSHQTWQNGPSPIPDSATRLDAQGFNDFARSIVALQTTLGANPHGTYGSVAARLNQFLPGAGFAPAFVRFTNALTVSIPGTMHRIGMSTILIQAYNNAVPAAAISPENFTVAVSPATYDVTVTFGQSQSGFIVLSAAPPVSLTSFTAATSVTVLGTTHLLATDALLWQIYSAANPSAILEPATFTVHPTTFTVTVTFAQPQSGTLLLSAMGPRYVTTFTSQTTVTVTGATHALGTQALLWQVYDAATPRSPVEPASVTVHPTNYDVTFTFGTSQSGKLVLAASQGVTGGDFTIQDAGIANTNAVMVKSSSGSLILQQGIGNHIFFRNLLGTMLADLDGAGRLGLGTTPSFQLHLATDSAAKPATNTWTISSDERLKQDLRPFTDGLAVLLQLEPLWYKYNGLAQTPNDGQDHVGFLAQGLQLIAPYLVSSYRGQLAPEEAETDILTYEGHALSFIMVNALKELAQRTIDHLALIDALTARVTTLEAQVSALMSP